MGRLLGRHVKPSSPGSRTVRELGTSLRRRPCGELSCAWPRGYREAMEFRLLGALEVALGDDLLTIDGALQRRLLAVLLVHARTVVSVDQLVDVLWGQRSPVDARQGLWTNVARLRRTLAAPP